MTEHVIKLASALPKGDPNGWADPQLPIDMWREKIEGRLVAPRVAVIIYDAQEAKVDKKGVNVTTVEVLRVQPVNGVESLRAVERALIDEYRDQTGAAKMTAEVEFVTKRAFAHLPRTDEEIDRIEAEEQDLMSATDETRRHLERVHGLEGMHLLTPEALDAEHDAEHNGRMSEALAHEPDWIGWTRADIEVSGIMTEDRIVDVDLGDADVILAATSSEAHAAGHGGRD